VVDNGSEDAKNVKRLVELKQLGHIDRIIALPNNMGFSIAFNISFEETQGDVFCYVSSDCLVQPGWLEAGLNTLESGKNTAAVCSNIFDDKHRASPEKDTELSQLYGAIMFIPRAAWIDIGCFDYLNFSPAYSEELDWSYRARKKGYGIMLSGRSLAYHNESYTMGKKYNSNDIHLIRLSHRIKCRLFNWSVKELVSSWKCYVLETMDDIKKRTIHILLMAFMRNVLMLPTILSERKRRSLSKKVIFEYPYKNIARII
jgi:GT2 family glycosyltransferase